MTIIYGQDWSSYQAAEPSTSGLSFVFIKATEGHTYTSPKQAAQAKHARAAGLVVGFYHFLHPGDVQTQAEYFVTKCASVAGDILACDWEPTSSGLASNADKDNFLKAVKKLRPDHKVVLYCDVARWTGVDKTSYCADGLWIASYTTAGKPKVEHPWTFHQYTSTPVDKDAANFPSKAALQAWATGKKPPAAKPKVSLAAVVYGATHPEADEKKHPSYADDVKHVQDALVKRKRLKADSYHSGIFDVPTKTAYAAEQRAQGYHGSDADGVPGHASLTELGKASGLFTAVA